MVQLEFLSNINFKGKNESMSQLPDLAYIMNMIKLFDIILGGESYMQTSSGLLKLMGLSIVDMTLFLDNRCRHDAEPFITV